MGNPTKAFQFRGKHYDSLSDFVKRHNLEREEFISRIRSGESLASIVDSMGGKVASRVDDEKFGKIKVGKKSFKNLKVACLSLGADVDIVSQYMDMGMSAENAFIAFFEKEKPVVNNKQYESAAEVARKYDVGEKKLLLARLENASYEEALLALGAYDFIQQHKIGAKALVRNVKRTFKHEDNETTEKVKAVTQTITQSSLLTEYQTDDQKQTVPPQESRTISTDIFTRD